MFRELDQIKYKLALNKNFDPTTIFYEISKNENYIDTEKLALFIEKNNMEITR